MKINDAGVARCPVVMIITPVGVISALLGTNFVFAPCRPTHICMYPT